MTPLQVSELAAFARQFRFVGGRLTAVRLQFRAGNLRLLARVRAQANGKPPAEPARPVRLRFELGGVEEYRFQKRLNSVVGKMSDLRLGYFNGLYFVNFDAWSLPPGEAPAIHDFRASDAYAAGQTLAWELVQKPA